MNSTSKHLLHLLLPALLVGGLAIARAAEPPKPSLTLEAVKVDPATPRPDTLCHLSVMVKNAGSQRASSLEFAVKVNGQELAAYKKRLYLVAVEPGATKEIRLFNFWATESGRPLPPDGKLNVEVTLSRASWTEKGTRDGAEVSTPVGEVPGLPVSKSATVSVTTAK